MSHLSNIITDVKFKFTSAFYDYKYEGEIPQELSYTESYKSPWSANDTTHVSITRIDEKLCEVVITITGKEPQKIILTEQEIEQARQGKSPNALLQINLKKRVNHVVLEALKMAPPPQKPLELHCRMSLLGKLSLSLISAGLVGTLMENIMPQLSGKRWNLSLPGAVALSAIAFTAFHHTHRDWQKL